jgi:hypothetical protein
VRPLAGRWPPWVSTSAASSCIGALRPGRADRPLHVAGRTRPSGRDRCAGTPPPAPATVSIDRVCSMEYMLFDVRAIKGEARPFGVVDQRSTPRGVVDHMPRRRLESSRPHRTAGADGPGQVRRRLVPPYRQTRPEPGTIIVNDILDYRPSVAEAAFLVRPMLRRLREGEPDGCDFPPDCGSLRVTQRGGARGLRRALRDRTATEYDESLAAVGPAPTER